MDEYADTQRRREAAFKGCEGIPTVALENGVVAGMFKLVALCALADTLVERKDDHILVPIEWWRVHFREPMDDLNATISAAAKTSPRRGR
jgi:hypothetical protein